MQKPLKLHVVGTILLLVVLAFSCKDGTDPKPTSKLLLVSIITPMSHPSLDQAVQGFQRGLSEKGYTEVRVKTELFNANGDFSQIPSLVKAAISHQPSVVFVVTTPAASEAVKITNAARVPLVYTAVTDPVSAQIVTGMDRSDTLATGVSDRYPVEEQVRTWLLLMPSMKKPGLLYNTAESNSKILIGQTVDSLAKRGIPSQKYEVLTQSEVASRTKQAIAECDAIIVNGDNLVTANLSEVINLCVEAKRPLFVGDPDSVRKGAIATVGPSYMEIGRLAGFKAALILEGTHAGQIASEYPHSFDYIVNLQAAKAMGLSVPEQYWGSQEIWESRASSKSK